MHGTRGRSSMGPTDSSRFGVSVPPKSVPACCSSLAQLYCLIYSRDMVQLTTYQVRPALGINVSHKVRIIKSSWISYFSSEWICLILGNQFFVQIVAKTYQSIHLHSLQGNHLLLYSFKVPLPITTIPTVLSHHVLA